MPEPTEFEFALLTVAGFCMKCMNQEAIDDILIVAVTPNGSMQFIGTGAVHPTNEEAILSEGSVLIFRNDLRDAIRNLSQEEAASPAGNATSEAEAESETAE